MVKKVYIAGPMTGYEYFNFPAFDRAKFIMINGYGFEPENVFSPADHDRELLNKPKDWIPNEEDSTGNWKAWAMPDAPSLRKMLGDDLAWIASEATDIYMLKGWERSSGAKAEHALAVALGLEIKYQ